MHVLYRIVISAFIGVFVALASCILNVGDNLTTSITIFAALATFYILIFVK
jgi:hypothetical protein